MNLKIAFILVLSLLGLNAFGQYTLDWVSPAPYHEQVRVRAHEMADDGTAFYAFDTSGIDPGSQPEGFRVIHFSTTGAVIYNKFFQDILPAGNTWQGIGLAPGPDGTLFLMGTYRQTAFPHAHYRLVYALDAAGNLLWQRTHAGSTSGNNTDGIRGLHFNYSADGHLMILDREVYFLNPSNGDIEFQSVVNFWAQLMTPSKTEAAVYVSSLNGFDRYLTKLTPSGIAWQIRPFPFQAAMGLGVNGIDMKMGPDGNVYVMGSEPNGGASTLIMNRVTPNGTVSALNTWAWPINDWSGMNSSPPTSFEVLSDESFFLESYNQNALTSTLRILNPSGVLASQRDIYDPYDPNVEAPIATVYRADVGDRVVLQPENNNYLERIYGTYYVERDLDYGFLPESRIGEQTFGVVVDANGAGQLLVNRGTEMAVYSPAGAPRPDAYSVWEGQSLSVPGAGVRTNDVEAANLTTQRMLPPGKGAMTMQNTGAFNYTSTGGWGTDAFTYRLWKGPYASRQETATITVKPVLPQVLTTNKLELYGGQTATLTVRLERPAPQSGAVVKITSSFFTVPATVNVPSGGLQVSFLVTALPSLTDRVVGVNATRATKTVSRSMTIKATTFAGLASNKSTLKGGGSFLLYVGLSGTALAPGLTVWLSSNQSVVPVPQNVVVPTGTSVKSITITTLATATTKVATITGSRGSVTKTVSVTVTP